MRAGTGRRSARARGKEVRNRKTFRQTTTPQRNQIRKTASTYGGRFLFLAGCTKGRNARARIPTSGNDAGPLPRGRRRRSEEAGDAGLETRRSETRKHAGRRHRSTQNGDTGARRTETAGTRRRKWTRNRQNCGKSGSPLPYFVPEFSPLRTLQTKGPVAKTTGPRFNVRCGYSSAATGSSVAAADSHDEQSVHSPAGSAHAAGSTAAGSETAAGSPAGSSVTARNSASSVWSS